MSLVACLSLISVLNVVLVTHARPENIFLSDPSEPLLEDPFHDANSNNNLLWNLDEIALNIPDLADITTTSDNIAPFIDTSNNLFATDSLDPLILASTCDTQGSLTDDFLQARDEGSCAAPENRQEEIELPKLFDEDFLLQGLGVDSIRPSNLPDRGDGSKGKPGDVGWSAFGAAIPADFQLQEDPQLCPEAIFLASRTPVCENSVTGGVVWEFGKLYATLLNVIPCRCFILRLKFFFRILQTSECADPRYPRLSTK